MPVPLGLRGAAKSLINIGRLTLFRDFRSYSTCRNLQHENALCSVSFSLKLPVCSQLKIMTRSLGTLNQKSRSNEDSKTRWISREEEEEEPEGDTPYVVYDGMLTSQIKGIKIFSITTSLVSLALQPAILESTISQKVPLLGTIGIFTMVGFFTFVTPLLIHLMTKKYVALIRYDPQTQTYTAVTFKFFLQKHEITFSKDDVIVPDVPGPFTTILVKKDGKEIPLFFGLESFRYPNHYGLIMGYDKPLDLHITPEAIHAALKRKESEKTRPKD